MLRRRPLLKNRPFKLQPIHAQLRIPRAFLIALLFSALGRPARELPEPVVLIGHHHHQPRILSLPAHRQRKILNAPRELQLMLPGLGEIPMRQCCHIHQRIRPIPHPHMQLRHRPLCLRQLHLYTHSDTEPSLLRVILAHPHYKLLLPPQLISPPDALRKLVVRALLKPMFENLWRRLGGNHFIQCLARRRQIILQLNRIHLQRTAVIEHAVGRDAVRWEIPRVLQIHPQQITHGVLVLALVQTPYHHAPALALRLLGRLRDRGVQPIQQHPPLGLLQGALLFRWHLSQIDHRPYLLPHLRRARVLHQIRR